MLWLGTANVGYSEMEEHPFQHRVNLDYYVNSTVVSNPSLQARYSTLLNDFIESIRYLLFSVVLSIASIASVQPILLIMTGCQCNNSKRKYLNTISMMPNVY